jgi:uncharacterized membrane protein YfcA
MTGVAPLAFGALVVLAAAFVRGYSGFGFAMVGVAGLALVLAPAVAVPVILVLEVLVGLLLLPPVRHEIAWRPVAVLAVGAAVTTPIGTYLLASIPADAARIAIAVVIALAALLLLLAGGGRPAPGTAATVGVGGVSGLLNGAFGVGGPPIALFFLSGDRRAAVSRASMMAYFLVIDVVALAAFGVGGFVDREVLVAVAVALPALAVGSWLGHRAFHSSDAARFRVRVLWILVALALLTGARGAWELVGPT